MEAAACKMRESLCTRGRGGWWAPTKLKNLIALDAPARMKLWDWSNLAQSSCMDPEREVHVWLRLVLP